MFWDESQHTVDAKNRVFLPKRFHAGLPLDENGSRAAVLTRGLDHCLYLFPEAEFERALDRMDTQAFAGADDLATQRAVFRFTTRIVLDASGRFLIPDKFLKLAGIEGEVVLCGMRNRIEIWQPARYAAMEQGNEEALSEFALALTKQARGRSTSASTNGGAA